MTATILPIGGNTSVAHVRSYLRGRVARGEITPDVRTRHLLHVGWTHGIVRAPIP